MPAIRVQDSAQSSPFIRQLASSDRRARDRALTALRTYLQRSTSFTELEFLKLWKGLFYCMFMSDKPRTQQQLARDLASLVDVLDKTSSAKYRVTNVLGFFDAFWKTMGREWSGIDSLRMDKFLYLIRCYVGKGFELCLIREPSLLAEQYLNNLQQPGSPLSPRDVKVPNGLRLHVLDVWIDEIEKADGRKKLVLEQFVRPVQKLAAETLTKSVRARAKETLEDERLREWAGGDEFLGPGEETDQDKGRDSDGGDFTGFDD